MQATGNIVDISIDFKTSKPKLTLLINEKQLALNGYDELKDKEKLSIEIKQWRNKRSKDANAYAWKLITEIGNILRKSKEEVYLQMLVDYGQSEIVSILSSADVKGYFKYYSEVGKAVLGDKEFTHYKIYKGSSEYDTKEMSIFIDGIVQEAKELNIQTLDDLEYERLVYEWKI